MSQRIALKVTSKVQAAVNREVDRVENEIVTDCHQQGLNGEMLERLLPLMAEPRRVATNPLVTALYRDHFRRIISGPGGGQDENR